MLPFRQLAGRGFAGGIRRSVNLSTRPHDLTSSRLPSNSTCLPAAHTRLRTFAHSVRFTHSCSGKCTKCSRQPPAEVQSGKNEQPPSTSDSAKTSATIIERTAMLTDPSLTDAEKLAPLADLAERAEASSFLSKAEMQDDNTDGPAQYYIARVEEPSQLMAENVKLGMKNRCLETEHAEYGNECLATKSVMSNITSHKTHISTSATADSNDTNNPILHNSIVSPYYYHSPYSAGVPLVDRFDDRGVDLRPSAYVQYKKTNAIPSDAPRHVFSLGHLLIQTDDSTEGYCSPKDDGDGNWNYCRSFTPTWFTVITDLAQPARPISAIRDLEFVGWIPKGMEEIIDEDDDEWSINELLSDLGPDKDDRVVGKDVLQRFSHRPIYPRREAAITCLASITAGSENPAIDLSSSFTH